MKDEEEFEDYLVDRAKEVLRQQTEVEEEDLKEQGPGKPEMRTKRGKMDEKVEEESTSEIPFSWDPREVEHLSRNRREMSNEDLKEFMEKDTEFHEKMEDLDEWKGFSRWEERHMVQKHASHEVEDIAEELGRDTQEVELKMHMMGLKVD